MAFTKNIIATRDFTNGKTFRESNPWFRRINSQTKLKPRQRVSSNSAFKLDIHCTSDHSSHSNEKSNLDNSLALRSKTIRSGGIINDRNIALGLKVRSNGLMTPPVMSPLDRPVHQPGDKLTDNHVLIPISLQKLNEYKGLSKKNLIQLPLQTPTESRFKLGPSSNRSKNSDKSVTNYVFLRKESITDSEDGDINISGEYHMDVLEYNQRRYLAHMGQGKGMGVKNMAKFIRRKSCECHACGGSLIKQKLGHLIVLEGEYRNEELDLEDDLSDPSNYYINEMKVDMTDQEYQQSRNGGNLSNHYEIRVTKGSEGSKRGDSSGKLTYGLQSDKNKAKLDTSRKASSGIGMEYFKSIFQSSRSESKIQRLSSMVHIMKKSKRSLLYPDHLISKLKTEIKSTKEQKRKLKPFGSQQASESKKDLIDAFMGKPEKKRRRSILPSSFGNNLDSDNHKLEKGNSSYGGVSSKSSKVISIHEDIGSPKNNISRSQVHLGSDNDTEGSIYKSNVSKDIHSSRDDCLTSSKAGLSMSYIQSEIRMFKKGDKNEQGSLLYKINEEQREDKKYMNLLSPSPIKCNREKENRLNLKSTKKLKVRRKLPKMRKTSMPMNNRLLSPSIPTKTKAILSRENGFRIMRRVKSTSRTPLVRYSEKAPNQLIKEQYTVRPYTKRVGQLHNGIHGSLSGIKSINRSSKSRQLRSITGITSPSKRLEDPLMTRRRIVEYEKYQRTSNPSLGLGRHDKVNMRSPLSRHSNLMSRSKPLSPLSPKTPSRNIKWGMLRDEIKTAYTQRD